MAGDAPRTGGDIEQAGVGAHVDGLQERAVCERRNGRKKRVIGLREDIMSVSLKLTERICVD
jgi:hypothetical protein